EGLEPYPGCRLSQFLGRGAWGEVWKAVMPDGPEAALKFLPCESTAATTLELRALQGIRQLRHPNLTRIDRVWCYSGYIVIAMELAEGNLLDLYAIYDAEFGMPVIPEHACHYLIQAAAAID